MTSSHQQRPPESRGRWFVLRFVLLGPLFVLGVTWGTAALWFDLPALPWLAAGFAISCAALIFLLRPFRYAVMLASAAFLLVLGWWLLIPPSNDREWQPDVARLATSSLTGNILTVRNLRNFDYRSETDFTEHWETRDYDLSQLRGADIFISFWGPTAIAHTIASWEFADSSHLTISIETRKEKGEAYSAVRGFFRQYELYYVMADERDLIRLRTNYRGEQVYLYRTTLRPEAARALLLDYTAEVNRLAAQPRWYNALTHNCTTTIRYHAKHVHLAKPLNWRLLMNGFVDQLLYERGMIDTTLPFAELRRRSNITEPAKAADHDPDFSRRIRAALPLVNRKGTVEEK